MAGRNPEELAARVRKLGGSLLEESGRFAEMFRPSLPGWMSFDTFVVSEDNFIAFEVGRTVAESPKSWKVFTPLHVCGSSGMGKTHLLAAMGRASKRRALCLNAGDLLIQFPRLAASGLEGDFAEWVGSHELLLLDDLQQCIGDPALQEHLGLLMSGMEARGGAVVVASDCNPGDAVRMVRALAARVCGGIAVNLGMVDARARAGILSMQFEENCVEVPTEVMEFLGKASYSSLRHLKAVARGIVARVLATGREVDLQMAREAIGSGRREESREPRAAVPPAPPRDVAARGESRVAGTIAERYKRMIMGAESLEAQMKLLGMALRERLEDIAGTRGQEEMAGRLRKAVELLDGGDCAAAMATLGS
jgi:chromosomal replication initiation ATPase DnaA